MRTAPLRLGVFPCAAAKLEPWERPAARENRMGRDRPEIVAVPTALARGFH